ncbi:MAG: hypothetical protein D6730_20595, partial [Bacteroidetes bacterium]
RLYPQPRIDDSPTTIIGFNHVGINVLDLDKMLAFYQKATGYELLERTVVANDEAADELFGQKGISYESAILKGPNMLLELREFANQQDTLLKKMPPQGPGITHTCYQSAMTASGFARFKEAGAEILTRGGAPVDLGGYGVTYAYAYDPEGNMLELEQMSERLIRLQIGTEWARQHPLWMTQVAIISPDLQRLVAFYQRVLGIKPYRMGSYAHNPGFDKIANLDSLAFDAAWFGMDGQGKKLELMQYVHPPTPPNPPPRALTAPGYTFSFEVLDIQQEYERLKKLGVRFVSTPQVLGPFRTVFAYDVDGNVFALRQALQDTSIYSLQNF